MNLIYTVIKGDTLSKIANRFNISMAELLESNPAITAPDLIYVGQRVTVTETENTGVNASFSGDENSRSHDREIGDTCEQCKRNVQSEETYKTTTIRISLFFDGTGNNATNIEERKGNTDTYKKVEKTLFFKKTRTGSYDNDKTNIAKLASLVKPDPAVEHFFPIYVEGIGTVNKETDSIPGLTLGTGDTGVKAKVKKGLKSVLDKIEKNVTNKATIIKYVYLDVFGFSRGAAAARYMVYSALIQSKTLLKTTLESKGYKVVTVKAKFIGLFDTVASYGVLHENDTADLQLNAISLAEKVVQLAAAEEHRKKFRLTNINSAGDKGTQIFLPGAHSDVGGGYIKVDNEDDHQILDLDIIPGDNQSVMAHLIKKAQERFEIFEKEKGWFKKKEEWQISSAWYKADEIEAVKFWNELTVNREVMAQIEKEAKERFEWFEKEEAWVKSSGWYKADKMEVAKFWNELTVNREEMAQIEKKAKEQFEWFMKEKEWLISSGWYKADEINEVNFWNELTVNRTGIKNSYATIPLQIMADYAAKGGILFKSLSASYPIPDELRTVNELIGEYIATSTNNSSRPFHWWDMESEEIKKLRHDYLHFSSSYGGIGGKDQPQFIDGERRRIIQDG